MSEYTYTEPEKLQYGTWGNADLGQQQYTGYFEPNSGYVYSGEQPSSDTRLGHFGNFERQFMEPDFNFESWFKDYYNRPYAGEDPKSIYSGVMEQVRQQQVAEDKRTDFAEGLMMSGAGAGIGALSGGFGIGDLFSNITGAGAGGGGAGGAMDMGVGLPEMYGPGSSWATPELGEFAGYPEAASSATDWNPSWQDSWSGQTNPVANSNYFPNLPQGAGDLATSAVNSGSMPSSLVDILKKIGVNNMTTQAGSYKFPWGTALSSVLSAFGNRNKQKSLEDLMGRASAAADPFAGQRPQYQTQLSELSKSPANFFNDPAIAEAIKAQMDKTNRYMAAQGYNMSGNQMTEVNNAGMREAFNQYLPFLQQISNQAGAQFGPGQSGSILATLGTGAANAGTQTQGDLGVLINSILRGQQPDLEQQRRGTPRTEDLIAALERYFPGMGGGN